MTLADFLFELGCEELPAGELAPMADYLAATLAKKLSEVRLQYTDIQTFYTPRRLAVYVKELKTETAAQTLERRGPAKVAAYDADGQPTRALQGFLKSCKANMADLIEVETDKGTWLTVKINQAAVAASTILPEILENAVKSLPVKKAMRWGNHDFSFVRPVHWITALHGDAVVPVQLFGLVAGRLTYGHRFHHPQAIALKQAADYVQALWQAFVMVDPQERRSVIQEQSQQFCPQGLNVHFGKLDEVVNLIEWPAPLLCTFAKEFLQVPQAVLISTMEANQRVFPIVDAAGRLQNYFITTANIESQNPEAVIEGNERVVRARLADARFFYEEDLKIPLENHLTTLHKITFQQGLGSLADKAARLEQLIVFLGQKTQKDTALQNLKAAAQLCKTDLVTQMVQEFPELQGYMGHQYALKQGKSVEVAEAIEEHYKPKGRGGALPQNTTGILLALADKIDTLVGLFAIGKEPTSSGDPYALRRQALGIIAILVEHKIHLSLPEVFVKAYELYQAQNHLLAAADTVYTKLTLFLQERMEVWFRDEKGLPITVVNAVLNRRIIEDKNMLDPYAVFERIEALTALLELKEGEMLKELAKRIGNILDQHMDQKLQSPNPSLFGKEENAVYTVFKRANAESWNHLPIQEQYLKYLEFGKPIADFFDHVMVNTEDAALRQNRQHLLQNVYAHFACLADFTKL